MNVILTIKAKLSDGQWLRITMFEDGSIKVTIEPPARVKTIS